MSKREQILTTTLDLVSELGFHETSISLLIKKSGVAAGTIYHHFKNKEDLLVSGFGKFIVKEKAERRGRNPQTTKDLQLRERRVVVFKTSGVLRNKIN